MINQADFDYSHDITDAVTMRKNSQLSGILFSGVMCSATESDQNGLAAMLLEHTVAVLKGDRMPDTPFHFSNGSVLIINSDNIEALAAVWRPFRASFFQSPEPVTDATLAP